jgi:uncharacterized protein with PQ loop repeat
MVLSIKKLWPLESGCTANSKILSSIFLNRFIINLLISHMGIQCTRYITCVRSGAEMGIFGGAGTPPPSCPSSRQCAEWARIYLKYCLCSPKDGVALTLGLLSVISWGVAEVPQIITNYRHKSTEGLSIAFLMTWIVGYAPALSLFFGCVFFYEVSYVPWNHAIIFYRASCTTIRVSYASCDALSYIMCYSLILLLLCRDLFNLVGCFLEPATVSHVTCILSKGSVFGSLFSDRTPTSH